MIKNESAIIKRCIEAGRKYSDKVFVCDTGSTDNTVEIVKELGVEVVQTTWKNFGSSRTETFKNAVKYATKLGWDLRKSYALVVDADMVLAGERPELGGEFGYMIIQKSSSMNYYNVRYLRLDVDWKCVGVTHEYWSSPHGETPKQHSILIDDIGDGGCKSDKFERDIRLLTQGLIDEPTNVRYMFYLGNTYRDTQKFREAIVLYKRRIKAGGWDEEIWHSMYSIAKCYHELKDYPKMELWAMRAIEARPHRNEVPMLMVSSLKDRYQHFKAWHYLELAKKNEYPKNDTLFIEREVYGDKIKYEEYILHYYVKPDDRPEGLRLCLDYVNSKQGHYDNAFNNFIYFCLKLNARWKQLSFPVEEPFTTSTIAINSDGVMNVRAVNYRMDQYGKYTYPDGIIRTKNYKSAWDPITTTWNGFSEIPEPNLPRLDKYIRGAEDIRLFGNKFTATTVEFSYCDSNRIIFGDYDDTLNAQIIRTPNENACEKNWLPIGGNNIIYNWFPFQIGEIREGSLVITKTIECDKLPFVFRYFRGSTPPFKVYDEWWAIVHLVKYGDPRHYMHMFVKLDSDFLPVAYTLPFVFFDKPIEYTAGAQCWDDQIHIFASAWDRESWCGIIDVDDCVNSFISISSS